MEDSRKILGLTKSQLARLLGVSEKKITDIEQGKMSRQTRCHLVALRILHKNELIEDLDALVLS
jgi:DNA-binding XRE family transcriptional regulator